MIEYWLNLRWRRRAKRTAKRLADRRHVDDDILSQERKEQLLRLEEEYRDLARRGSRAEIRSKLDAFKEEYRRIIPYDSLGWLHGWLDLIAVVAMVACGIRGLYFQPFQIPTSSMQPTLYGIHYMNDDARAGVWTRAVPAVDWLLFSTRRAELTVEAAGTLDRLLPVTRWGLFDYTEVGLGGHQYLLPGTPQKVADYAHFDTSRRYGDRRYRQGEKVVDGWLSSGDHLFVDRISFHLTGLDRGDVVVFTTEGIIDESGRPLAESSGYFYIKRLVGLPGDTLRMTEAGLEVKPAGAEKFRPVVEFGEAFAKLYSGLGGYQAHSPYVVGGRSGKFLARYGEEFRVPEDAYFMLGDNVMFSSDSRMWGPVPRANIVGRALVAFWPFSRRWGWIDDKEPLPMATGTARGATFDVMGWQ